MRRFLVSGIVLAMLLQLLGAAAFAEDGASDAALCLETQSGGAYAATVAVGDTLQVDVRVCRTDSAEEYLLYAVQDEIEYDTALLEFLPNEGSISYGFQQGYRSAAGGHARVLVNFVDMTGQGAPRAAELTVATLKFRAKAAGATELKNQSVIATDAKGNPRTVSAKNLRITIKNKTPGGSGGGISGGSGGGISGGSGGGTTGTMPAPGGTTQPSVTTPDIPNDPEFQDVAQSAWYYPAVTYAARAGYFTGVGGGLFLPDAPMTRAMFVTVLYRMAGGAEASGESFPDVARGSWYEQAAIWAARAGIVKGSGGCFLPEREITREQLATMLARYAKYQALALPDSENQQFADDAAISDWAKDAVYRMRRAGLLAGRGENLFEPKAQATRAEVAQLVKNLAELKEEK